MAGWVAGWLDGWLDGGMGKGIRLTSVLIWVEVELRLSLAKSSIGPPFRLISRGEKVANLFSERSVCFLAVHQSVRPWVCLYHSAFATLQLFTFATLQLQNFATLELCNFATVHLCNFVIFKGSARPDGLTSHWAFLMYDIIRMRTYHNNAQFVIKCMVWFAQYANINICVSNLHNMKKHYHFQKWYYFMQMVHFLLWIFITICAILSICWCSTLLVHKYCRADHLTVKLSDTIRINYFSTIPVVAQPMSRGWGW